MKATLGLHQGGLNSVYVVFTWLCGELKKHKDMVRLQNIEIFHFTLLEPVLGRNLMVSSLCFQCLAGLPGKSIWELQKLQRKWGTSPEWEGEMSPVLRPQYQTGVYHGLKKPWWSQETHVSPIFILHYSFGCWLFFLFLLESFLSCFVLFLLNSWILCYPWLEAKSIHSGWNTISLEEEGMGISHSWGGVALRATWISLLPVLGTGVIFTWFPLSSWDRVMYRLRALSQLRGCPLWDIKHF